MVRSMVSPCRKADLTSRDFKDHPIDTMRLRARQTFFCTGRGVLTKFLGLLKSMSNKPCLYCGIVWVTFVGNYPSYCHKWLPLISNLIIHIVIQPALKFFDLS